MKPLILLTGGTGAAANGTPTWALNQNYAENIRRAGGIPILAVNNDCAEEYADLADGLLLSGGKDVEPKLYGQEKMFDFVITDPQRDDLEYKIIKAFVDRRKPIWGICRGIQILNVYFGGTLTQDIPTQLGGDHSKGVCHQVTLKKDSILGNLYGESMEVNTRPSTSSAKVSRPSHGASPTDTPSQRLCSTRLFRSGPYSGTRSA